MNGGYRMTGWFDLMSFNKINAVEDEEGLRDSMRCAFGHLGYAHRAGDAIPKLHKRLPSPCAIT